MMRGRTSENTSRSGSVSPPWLRGDRNTWWPGSPERCYSNLSKRGKCLTEAAICRYKMVRDPRKEDMFVRRVCTIEATHSHHRPKHRSPEAHRPHAGQCLHGRPDPTRFAPPPSID